MQRADSAVREFFLMPAGRVVRVCLFIGLMLAGFMLCLHKQFALAPAGAERIAAAVLFAIPLALMLFFLFHARQAASPTVLLTGGAACVLAMLMRLCFIDRSTGDFGFYLNEWLNVLAGQSFGASMRMQVGEYHVLYQYILYFISRFPLPWLYTVKAVSFIGDAFLAGAAFRILDVTAPESKGNRALLVLLLPAIVLNGGMFAQCDSLYTASLLWGLAFILEGKSAQGMACTGLALCFKLQALFLFPLLPLLWLAGKIRLKDLIPFFVTVLLIQLPAILGGKNPLELITIYTGQTGMYTNLNYGAPNLWALIVTEGLDSYAYGTFGIALALGTCLLVMSGTAGKQREMTAADWTGTAALIVLTVFFCLPRMHERYIYAGELLLCLYALSQPRALPAALAVSLASLAALWMTAIPLWGGALLVLASLTCLLLILFARKAELSGPGRPEAEI